MTQAIQTISKALVYRERIFWLLVVGIVFSSISYGFFIQKAISNVVLREKIISESRVLGARVSDLESKFFSIKSGISMETALANGFTEPKETQYISRKSLRGVLSFNNEI